MLQESASFWLEASLATVMRSSVILLGSFDAISFFGPLLWDIFQLK
jgi:hypothetical protein